jgi:hypothetical protein
LCVLWFQNSLAVLRRRRPYASQMRWLFVGVALVLRKEQRILVFLVFTPRQSCGVPYKKGDTLERVPPTACYCFLNHRVIKYSMRILITAIRGSTIFCINHHLL